MGTRRDFLRSLASVSRVVFDTSACLYYLSREGIRAELLGTIVARAAEGLIAIDLPGIVHLELLVGPYRRRDPFALKRIEKFVLAEPGISASSISRRVLMTSAEVRALTGLKAPDAMVVGAAIVRRCGAIVGNDERFKMIGDLGAIKSQVTGRELVMPRYVHLDDYIGAP